MVRQKLEQEKGGSSNGEAPWTICLFGRQPVRGRAAKRGSRVAREGRFDLDHPPELSPPSSKGHLNSRVASRVVRKEITYV